jgi:hypothetical protein
MRSTALRRFGDIIASPKLIFRRSKVFGAMKMGAKKALAKASKAVWRVPLDREGTFRMLAGREIRAADDGVLRLPDREPASGARPSQFGARDVPLDTEYVWQLQRDDGIRSMRIASSGTILLNGKYLLDTDFGSVPGVTDLPFRRRRHDVDVAIAPWAHKWATYYEFVVHILSKLCRIKEVVDPSVWAAAKVCYPLLRSPYERQYLSLIGLSESDLLDPRQHDLVPRSLVISNLQSKDRLTTPTRLASLRRALLGGDAQHTKEGGRRLYLSRVGYKRQVLNEDEVRRVVTSRGLEVIESIPESVEEQIRMFSEASVIVSAHGSALANLVWCSPGTRVIELFTRSFTSDVYSALCHVLGLRHVYLVDNADEPHHWTNLHKDIVVDIPSFVTTLDDACARRSTPPRSVPPTI